MIVLGIIGSFVVAFISMYGWDTFKEIIIKNDELINSCTMDGKSHDELHKWLAPHLELVEKLGASDDAEAKELVSKLADSYKTYHEYFQ